MAIRLLLTQDGNLEINSLEQKNFSIDDIGISILFPLKTIEKGEHHIVVDPLDKLGEVLEYLVSEFKKNKFSLELDHHLKRYWENYIFEKTKIRELKNKKKKSKNRIYEEKIFKTKRKPLFHQLNGIDHALTVENAANFSVPGSGKTQTALGTFSIWKKNNLIEKAFVIGPASCFEPWETESMECLKYPLKIVRWSGSVSQRRRVSGTVKDADLILITYQTACNDYPLLQQVMRRYKFLLILDESHYIKSQNSARSQLAIRLAPFASKRLILTGTPAPHSLIDLWTQFSFLWPSRQLLGDYQTFKDRIEKDKNPINKLKNELRPFFIRTTKKELGLPDIEKDIIIIKKSLIPFEQQKVIDLLELKTLHEARKLNLSDIDMNVLRKWRSARIIRLLQAASNPALLLSRLDSFGIDSKADIDASDLVRYASVFIDEKKLPAKVEVVIKLAKTLMDAGKKVIIWSWFIDNLKLMQRLLNTYNPLLIYGEIKPYEDEDAIAEESRERYIHQFKTRRDRPVLLANPAACAESISLHKNCQHAIYLDRNFNCGQFLQSMDRIHRVGMPAGLTAEYHIPVINCAVERAVDKRLKIRQAVLYEVLNDRMPVLGIDEDMWIADSADELETAYNDVIKEIKNEKEKKSI